MAEAGGHFGRYELRGELGKGGFATVYRAWDAALAREVALKALQPHLSLDANIRQRFMAEARAIAQLHHPNIVTVHEVDEANGRPFFTMELVNGPTLAALVAPGQGLPLGRVAEIMRSLASAVDYLHTRRLVHRDIKASNVMLDAWGRVVLMDFGVARALDQTQLTQSGISIGTPEAMAPEQVRGQPAGPPADIYAIGVLAYRLLAGRAPFVGETIYVLHAHAYESPPSLAEFRPGLPDSVYAAIESSLAKAPQDRPVSAEQFAAALSVPSSETTMGDTTARFMRLPARPPGERTPPPEPARQPPAAEPQTPLDRPPDARSGGAAAPTTPAPTDHERTPPAAPPEAPLAPQPGLPNTQTVPQIRDRAGSPRRAFPWPIVGGIVGVLVLAAIAGAVLLAARGGSNKNTSNGSIAAGGSATEASTTAATTTRAAGGTTSGTATTTAVASSATSSPVATSSPTRTPTTTAPPTSVPAIASLLAGSGKAGYAEGRSDQAQLSAPKGVAIDGSGTLFFTDSDNNRVRKLSADGTTSLLAGPPVSVTATRGLANGTKDTVRFTTPWGIAVDKQGNVYVADTGNNRIRKIAPNGTTTIFAGNPDPNSDTGLGAGVGLKDGKAGDARFNQPTGLAIDAAGNLYVADTRNNRIRKIAPDGTVSTLAGSSAEDGYADGPGNVARFHQPTGIAVDAAGIVYVADTDNNVIRKIATNGEVSLLAGTVSGGAGVQGSADGPARKAGF
ncbi:MAG: serine/threonine-protein kinase, partial [Dehalococcoidia bacterium]